MPWLKRPFQTVVSTPVLSWGFIPTTPRNTWLNSGRRPVSNRKNVSCILCALCSLSNLTAALLSRPNAAVSSGDKWSRSEKRHWRKRTPTLEGEMVFMVSMCRCIDLLFPPGVTRASSSCIYCVIFLPKNVIFKACRPEDPTFMEASPKMKSLFISCQCAKKCVWWFKV